LSKVCGATQCIVFDRPLLIMRLLLRLGATQKGLTWKGHKTHMGWGQEAFDATLSVPPSRGPSKWRPPGAHAIGAVTIFTDAQAAIWRMASDDPGPGQKYALEARRYTAALHAKEPNTKIEIRWCPSHQGIEGNEVVDGWARLAADEPDAHGVEWFSTTNPDGSVSERKFPTLACQCQARLLRAEVGRSQRLRREATRPDR